MIFKEFYKLLDEAITKEKSYVNVTEENYNFFLFNRYLSFYDTEIAIHIAKTANRNNWIPDGNNCNSSWECINGIIPKLPRRFINYIKKPSVETSQQLDISEEVIADEAIYNECSKREIRDLILNYARRREERETV